MAPVIGRPRKETALWMTTNLQYAARWVNEWLSGRSASLRVVPDCACGAAPTVAHTKPVDCNVANLVGAAIPAGRRC